MKWRHFRLFGRDQHRLHSVDIGTTTDDGKAPANTHRIQSANELLLPRGEWVKRIETLAGTTRPHFAQYYLPVIKRFAEFVQLCPASEAHHHAHLGGLIDHALEVAACALQIRQGYLLPPKAPAEERPLRQDTWTYAVFTGAFLHDVGKPAVDMAITLYSSDGRADWPWNPWLGRMCENRQAWWYRMTYRKARQYQTHERTALLLVQHLIPADGIAWLSGDDEAFAAWLAYACGDSLGAGVLGEILTQADRHSVAQNLGAETGPRAIQSHTIPLHEKLLTALRYLIEHQELPLNRNGAAGWLIQADLWLVSKRVADALRAHLTLNGHGGIPTANDRLFDALQDHGILVPNGDRAIWMAEILGDKWAHTLTLLRIPAHKVWPDSDRWPPAFDGAIRLKTESEQQPPPGQELAPPNEHNEHEVRKTPRQTPRPKPDVGADVSSDNPGQAFICWVREGLSSGQLPHNCADARVHVVSDGVFLISPAIFRDYADARPETGDWQKVQRQFLKLGVHQTQGDVNIQSYRINDSGTTLSGLLIADVRMLFDGDATLNPALVKI